MTSITPVKAEERPSLTGVTGVRGYEYRILLVEYWIPIVLWLTAIYFFSTDSFSAGETSRFIGPLLKFFFPYFTPAEIELWHGIIRKLAHVAEYFVLAVFTYRILKFNEPALIKPKILAIAFVLASALLDEFHQSQTVLRGASLMDVGYDCLGGVLALCVMAITEVRWERIQGPLYAFRRLHPRSFL